ncbi:MAG: 16S rRNA (uracil(1498)-N(3))-methyltransferase [Alphaproteobacteria bacterium]|nr:16S rRNA (uracil(1498)-N(3))-methyltransferase [Alphaproteobacteria bacterium]QQS57400.1 MAG: 16S rRNA (uracil(1498)-N(3))-methyltransferase [Alphaproteobacteria bacterium]
MTQPLYKLVRLYLNEEFSAGREIALSDDHVHYLRNVLRLEAGQGLRVFNGRDGEWRADLKSLDKKRGIITLQEILKPQTQDGARIRLLFAPIKKQRMDFLIEKAVELGATDFYPILTGRTENRHLKAERVTAQMIEAAEQCERLDLPVLHPMDNLQNMLKAWDGPKILACVERMEAPVLSSAPVSKDCAFLIGPEGGFDSEEGEFLKNSAKVQAVGLGDTILRAETAALLCLSYARMQLL